MPTLAFRGRLPKGVTRRSVERLVVETLAIVGERAECAIGIAVVDDAEIRRLNREYRDKDAVTDVLSFGYDEGGGEVDVDARGTVVRELGDIVIDLAQVRRQSSTSGRTIAQEFSLMVVHGTLHLLGYDHETEAEERTMFGLQQEVLLRTEVL